MCSISFPTVGDICLHWAPMSPCAYPHHHHYHIRVTYLCLSHQQTLEGKANILLLFVSTVLRTVHGIENTHNKHLWNQTVSIMVLSQTENLVESLGSPWLHSTFFFFFLVFIEFVTILLLFYVLFCFCFCFLAMRHVGPQPGVEPTLPALEGEVSTTEPPEKSPEHYFLLLETICPNSQQGRPWHSFQQYCQA